MRFAMRVRAGVSRSALLLAAGASLVAPAFAGETITYTYDARGRLVQVDHAGTVNNGVSAAYTYDKADNRTNVTVTGSVPPVPTFSVSDASVTEGGSLSFTISKAGTASSDLTVDYATSGGTATAGSDYTTTSGTLIFHAADTALTVTVPTIDDSAIESSETVNLVLSNAATGSVIGDGQGVGTITDNDVSFSINNASAIEGSPAAFTVTKTGSGAGTVDYATTGGTATSGTDFTATSGTLNFAAGVASKTINVPTTADVDSEPDETFAVNLSNPSTGGIITTAQGTGTIVNNTPTVTISIGDASAVEGQNLTFTVSITGSRSSNVTVDYDTADGTAVSGIGGDYNQKSGQLQFRPTDTSLTVKIPAINNSTPEPTEYFYVNLSNATGGAAIIDSQGVGTIIDND